MVENRPGAAGNVGAESFSRAPPDGYTLLASPPTTLAINQSLYKKLNYDPTKFKPITILGSSPNVLIVNPKLGVSTVKELIEKAKADPGAIAYGSQGIGATSHLTTALFETMAGVKFNHVPYRGTAPAMNDLVGGHILFMFDNLSSSLPQHQAGTLKILAVCTPERSPLSARRADHVGGGAAGLRLGRLVRTGGAAGYAGRRSSRRSTRMSSPCSRPRRCARSSRPTAPSPSATRRRRWRRSWSASARCGAASSRRPSSRLRSRRRSMLT